MQSRVIDVCRGAAALWVVCVHHTYSPAFVEQLPRVHQFLKAGFLGVPMFFVVSGYCIAASADGCVRKRESTGGFLRRRFLRIYPPFWASLLVVVGAIPLVSCLGYLKSGVYPDFPIESLGQDGMA